MVFTYEFIKDVMGKRTRIIGADMDMYDGIITEYIHADDSHNGNAGVILETAGHGYIRLYEDGIREIFLYEPETEERIASIKKVRYKIWESGLGTIDEMETLVYELYPDGRAFCYSYRGRNRSYTDKDVRRISGCRMYLFLRELAEALEKKDAIVCEGCDGCSYNLQITYADGHKDTIEGYAGGGTYDGLLTGFMESIFE